MYPLTSGEGRRVGRCLLLCCVWWEEPGISLTVHNDLDIDKSRISQLIGESIWIALYFCGTYAQFRLPEVLFKLPKTWPLQCNSQMVLAVAKKEKDGGKQALLFKTQNCSSALSSRVSREWCWAGPAPHFYPAGRSRRGRRFTVLLPASFCPCFPCIEYYPFF